VWAGFEEREAIVTAAVAGHVALSLVTRSGSDAGDLPFSGSHAIADETGGGLAWRRTADHQLKRG
jgi:hypothetical protein